jgi:hypothetical protein
MENEVNLQKSRGLWVKVAQAAQTLEGYEEFSWGWRMASEGLHRAVEIARAFDKEKFGLA